MKRYATAPAHVAACDLGHATVLVNYRTGGVHTLVGATAQWWGELATTGDTSSPTTLDRRSAERLIGQLRTAGLLVDTARPEPWSQPVTGRPWRLSFGTDEVQAGWVSVPRVPGRTVVVAGLALLITITVLHVGHRATNMARLLRLLQRAGRLTVRPAGAARVTEVIHAVRRVGLFVPGRVACLEESAAAVLTLALYRQWVTWCHGVVADPISLHAWVETDGQPVAEPATTSLYTVLRRISGQHKGDDYH